MVRLEKVLNMIATSHGYKLLVARVYYRNHVLLFVSAPLKMTIPVMVNIFKCVSAELFLSQKICAFQVGFFCYCTAS